MKPWAGVKIKKIWMTEIVLNQILSIMLFMVGCRSECGGGKETQAKDAWG